MVRRFRINMSTPFFYSVLLQRLENNTCKVATRRFLPARTFTHCKFYMQVDRPCPKCFNSLLQHFCPSFRPPPPTHTTLLATTIRSLWLTAPLSLECFLLISPSTFFYGFCSPLLTATPKLNCPPDPCFCVCFSSYQMVFVSVFVSFSAHNYPPTHASNRTGKRYLFFSNSIILFSFLLL